MRFITYLGSNLGVLEIYLMFWGSVGVFRCFLSDIFLGSNLGVLNFWTFLRVTGCFREIIGVFLRFNKYLVFEGHQGKWGIFS